MHLTKKTLVIKKMSLLCLLAMMLSLLVVSPVSANTLLTSPTAGESYTAGSEIFIRWTPPSHVFKISVTLEFSSDSGATWTNIVSDWDIDKGKRAWTVPNTPTTKARVRLTAITDMPAPLPNSQLAQEESGDFTIKSSSVLTPGLPKDPNLHTVLAPDAPENLTASAASSTKISLSWDDKSTNESGFKIERKSSGDFEQIATVAADVKAFQDVNLTSNTSYTYRIRAYNALGNSSYSNEATAKTNAFVLKPTLPIMPIVPLQSTQMRFYIGSSDYYVGSDIKSMDTVPQILESRTILPIRYVVEPLGATLDWNANDQKVTIAMGNKTIILYINNNIASVNGAAKAIDPDNANVKPLILPPGRTMLPLRFIAEELGCKVDWNPNSQEIKITYPDPD